MRNYTVILLQLMIWSGFTLIEWLSKDDQLLFNILMFFIFFYLAVVIGNYIIKSKKKTLFLTLISLALYSTFHLTLTFI